MIAKSPIIPPLFDVLFLHIHKKLPHDVSIVTSFLMNTSSYIRTNVGFKLPQGGSPRDSRGFHQVGEPPNFSLWTPKKPC
jgi:hypothetical protein